ncbi:hypothetical protein C8T65DRAFT_644703, partial [Cerioporus squamosus]
YERFSGVQEQQTPAELLEIPAGARPPLSRTVSNTLHPGAHSEFLLQAKKNTILKSHGRPPWYDEDGHSVGDAFVIGIAGGSASGKTHVARRIVQALGSIPTVVILSQDSFYRRHSPEDLELAFANRYDFDHPDAIDMPLFASVRHNVSHISSFLGRGHATISVSQTSRPDVNPISQYTLSPNTRD